MNHRRGFALAALLIALGLAATACGDDSESVATTGDTASPAESTTAPLAGETTAATSSPDDPGPPDDTGFTPERPLPPGFPVFPGAVLSSDVPESFGGYMYLFATEAATNPDICEFYAWELAELGFDVVADCTDPREFYVEAGRSGVPAVSVTFTDDSGEPGAGYLLVIDYEVWQDEWIAP